MRGTAAIYTRISEDRAGESLGTQRQEQLCRDLAKRLELTVTEVYTDNDIGASSRSRKPRPQYAAMLAAARRGDFSVILAYANSRLTRRPAEWEDLIKLAEGYGVTIRTVSSGDTNFTTADGRAVARTISAWDAAEAERLGERVAAQKAQAARQGRWLGGARPFGWNIKNHTPTVNEAEADAIREGVAMVLSGQTFADVSKDWESRGLVNRAGRPFGATSIKQYLQRPRNAGLVTYHGETVATDWPAILTLDELRQLQAVINSPQRRQQHKIRHLLSGVMTCWCGRTVGAGYVPSKGRAYYRCTIHAESARYVQGHVNRAAPLVDAYVRDVIASGLERTDVRAALTAAEEARMRPAGHQDHQRELTALTERRDSLARLFAQGTITEAQLTAGTAEVQQQLRHLEAATRRRTGSAAAARILVGDDPAQAFRDAPVLAQREVIAALVDVQCVNNIKPGKHGFRPDSVRITWKSWPGESQ